MFDWLLEPLTYGFMQRGLAASVMVGVLCAVVGCYVVLRGMAFLGDALAHAILPGVALAYLLKGNLMLGALIAAVVVGLGIGYLSRQGKIREDTAIGIWFAAALALGVAMISTVQTYAVDLTHILFGNILGVSPSDLLIIAVLGVIVIATIVLLYKEFLVVSFDRVLAATLRLPVEVLRNLMLILIALDDRRLASGRRRGIGGRDAGDAGGDGLSAHAALADDDGDRSAHRRVFRCGGAVP